MSVEATSLPLGGFNFENTLRNSFLESKGLKGLQTKKTGTTIVAALFKDGVVLGADTRATSGPFIADKFCDKIHYLQKNIYCCGAGTAADTDFVTSMISSNLELHRLATDRIVPVAAATRMIKQHLFRYQGHIGAALIVGGVDETGSYIYSIAPHGSSHQADYTSMGSGSLAAMSVLEREWKPNMNMEECKKLVRDAIRGGIFNDMGSGNVVDLCVITKEGSKSLRPYEVPVVKGELLTGYGYKKGATAILSAKTIPFEVIDEQVVKTTEEDMDVSG